MNYCHEHEMRLQRDCHLGVGWAWDMLKEGMHECVCVVMCMYMCVFVCMSEYLSVCVCVCVF